MRLTSRGLGRKELVMDFREYDVIRNGDEILVVGTINEPVHWDFTIRMCEDDLAGIARVAVRRPMIALILRSAIRRNKHHHWNTDRKTHVAEVIQRRQGTDSGPKDAPIDDDGAKSPRATRAARRAQREAPVADVAVPPTPANEAVAADTAEAAAPVADTTVEERPNHSNLRPVVNRSNRTRRGLVLESDGDTPNGDQGGQDDSAAVGL
jgi:hypothetical protein